MVWEVAYGRLDYVLSIEFPADPTFGFNEPCRKILAHITEARDAIGDATESFVSYQQMGRSFVLDIQCVENVVGRIKTSGVVEGGEWIIVDRSSGTCRTVFHNEELRDPDDGEEAQV
jgi:hypothetical protein